VTFDANGVVHRMCRSSPCGKAHEAIKELMQEGESSNTRSSYQSAMRYWAAWHLPGQAMQLPLQVSTVLQFIIDHAQRIAGVLLREMPPKSMKPCCSRLQGKKGAPQQQHAGASHGRDVQGTSGMLCANPCQDGAVKELMRTRKAYARRGALPQKKRR
jgi:hypothetical protein